MLILIKLSTHHANTNPEKAIMAFQAIISEKVDFRARKITRDKEGYYIMMKGQFTKKR